MPSSARRAIEAYATTVKKAERLADAIDKLPDTGVPIAEIHEEDSMVIEIEKARAAKSDVEHSIVVARTRSQDI